MLQPRSFALCMLVGVSGLMPLSTHAQFVSGETCANLTTKQQQRIKFISSVVEKSDLLAARIVNADPGASALLSQRLQQRNRQLASECNYRQLDRYIRTMVMDMLALQQSYKAQQKLTSDPAAEQAMIVLQQQLLSVVGADQVKQLDKPVAISSDAGITVNVNIPQMGKASMNITIGTKGQFDLQKGHFDTNIKANGMMSLEQFMEITKLSVKALGDIDVTNINDLYVRINTLSFEGTTSDLEQQLMMDYAKTMVNQVSQTLAGKSINLTATGSTGNQEYQYNQGVSMSTALTQMIKQQADSYEMLNMIQKTPMMKFYRQENGMYYGSLNPELCALSADTDTKQSCLAQMTQMLYDAEGYGPVAVQMNNGQYTLALSDTYIDDKMSDDMKHLNNKPIIYRNNQNLTKIEVPFNPTGTSKLLYTNPEFVLVVKDPEIDLSITGTISAQGIDLNGKGTFPDSYRGTMSRKSVFQPVNSSSVSANTTDIKINGYQESSQLFDVSVNSTQTVDPTSNRHIQAPNPSITLESAMKLLQPILGNSFSLQYPDEKPTEEMISSDNNPNKGTLSAAQITSLKKNMYIKGSMNAKITFIQYMDLVEVYSQKMHEDATISTLMQQYPEQVNVLMKNFVIYENTQKAAEALFCIAAVKGKDGYYQAIDKIFVASDLSVDGLDRIAQGLGVSAGSVKKCLNANTYTALVESQKQEGMNLFNISGTPGNVLLDNKTGKYIVISGAYPYKTFENAIKELLSN